MLINKNLKSGHCEDGFSLVELIMAMTLTLVVLGISSTLLANAFAVRTRSNDNVDGLADAERALNILSREIAQAGFNLTDNGLVDADSVTDGNGNSTIRVRANLNKFNTANSDTARSGIGVQGEDAGEDVKYFIFPTANTTLLARYDPNAAGGPASTVLANRLDSLRIHYFAGQVTYNTDLDRCDITGASAGEVLPSAATYVVLAVCVRQQAVSVPGSPGYQPAQNVLLTTDVTLRNANLTRY